MDKLVIPMSFVLATLLAVPAFAQTKGEADPPEKTSITKRVTPAEKAAAKSARKAQGATVAKASKTDDSPASTGVAKSATVEERQAAKVARRTAAADAVKKGQTSSGEK